MSNLEILWPFILSWEGGFANVKGDKGGATKYGVTISTWKAQGYDVDGDGDIDIDDLKCITEKDAMEICRRNYWDRWHADQIENQSVANLLVDWVWSSGKNGIIIPQQVLGVKVDGVVGPITIKALNDFSPNIFLRLWSRRKRYLYDICYRNATNYKFLAGWLNRLDGIKYGHLVCNTIPQRIIRF